MRQWSLPGLHLLVTSRDLPEIRDHLHPHDSNLHGESVLLNHDNVQQDIQEYVTYQVNHDPQLRRWGDHREKIKNHLVKYARGVFRWVECQLEPLRHCPRSVKHLEKRLGALPQSLDETYERMLCDIDVDSRSEAQRLLALLCCSTRPLSVGEVIDASAVDVDEGKGFDPDGKFEGADDLLRICPGMIEIDRPAPQDDDDQYDHNNEDDSEFDNSSISYVQDKVVRIAHFSVQEYLMSDRIRRGRAAHFAVSEGCEHIQISHICLLYLGNDNFLSQTLTPDLIKQFPFARFAAENWYYHYRQGDGEVAISLVSLVIEFLTNSEMLDRWLMLHEPHVPRHTKINYQKSFDRKSTAMYYAALFGLNDVLVGILNTPGIDIDAHGGYYGNALQAASRNGHDKLVQILLDRGACINAQGGHYDNALQAASDGGNEKVVQILLDNNADVNLEGVSFGSPLQAASRHGHEKIVQILLDKGANVNAKGAQLASALQAASVSNHEKIVQTLLDKGADVNVVGGYFGTALQAASAFRYTRIVQILLDKGADVNTQGGAYGNALQVASFDGSEEIVQILLERGADVHAQGGLCGTALQAALRCGHEKVVQILLQNGAKE